VEQPLHELLFERSHMRDFRFPVALGGAHTRKSLIILLKILSCFFNVGSPISCHVFLARHPAWKAFPTIRARRPQSCPHQ